MLFRCFDSKPSAHSTPRCCRCLEPLGTKARETGSGEPGWEGWSVILSSPPLQPLASKLRGKQMLQPGEIRPRQLQFWGHPDEPLSVLNPQSQRLRAGRLGLCPQVFLVRLKRQGADTWGHGQPWPLRCPVLSGQALRLPGAFPIMPQSLQLRVPQLVLVLVPQLH